MNDHELLLLYVRDGSEPAFAELVRRHTGWVFSVCRRQVGDATLAQDVTQAVFIVLARKAATFKHAAPLTGWLHRTARYASSEALRREARRHKHERQAAAAIHEATMPTPPESMLAALGPELDAALARLSSASREAVVQRYYAGRSFLEVSKALGVSEDAAKKRVSRALEQLHGMLKHRLAMLTVAGLASTLAAAGAEAAPSMLAAASVAAATTGKAVGPTLVADGVIKFMAMAKLKFAASVAAAVMVAAVSVGAIVIASQPSPPPPATSSVATPASVPTRKVEDPIVLVGDPGLHRVIPRQWLRLTHDSNVIPRFEASLEIGTTPAWDMAQAQILVARDGPRWTMLVQTQNQPQRVYGLATEKFLVLLDEQNPGGLIVVDAPKLVLEFHASGNSSGEIGTLTCDLRLDPNESRIAIDAASVIALMQRDTRVKTYDPKFRSIRLGNQTAAGSIFLPEQPRDGESPVSTLSISSNKPRMSVVLRDIRLNTAVANRWIDFDANRLAEAGMPIRKVTAQALRQSLVPAAAFWTTPSHGVAATRFHQWINSIVPPAKP